MQAVTCEENPMSDVRIFLCGCNGRMGKVITDICLSEQGIAIVAGADINGANINTDSSSYPVYSRAVDCKEKFDVIIDFSHVLAFSSVIELAEKSGKPLVMCTTGLSEENKKTLSELSGKSAVFYSANMSLGVNILICLVKKAADVLYPGFDIEIVEAHHNQKLDAPSGTALMIADAINETLNNQLEYVYDRHDVRQKRGTKELGMHSIRGGSIVGEHSIIFAGPEEVLTLSHSAQTRSVFARGAVAAARFMSGKKSGMYSMQDLIG
jgi:4-hydroxy-tetrahydrodipicolinate reductase